jgi:hypothetical protein
LAGLGPGTAFKFDIGPGRHNRSSRLVLASPQVLIPNVGWFGGPYRVKGFGRHETL